MTRSPAYLRGAPRLSGRLRDLLELDDLVHDDRGCGILTQIDEAELEGQLARAMREIRQRRRLLEKRQTGGKFR